MQGKYWVQLGAISKCHIYKNYKSELGDAYYTLILNQFPVMFRSVNPLIILT